MASSHHDFLLVKYSLLA